MDTLTKFLKNPLDTIIGLLGNPVFSLASLLVTILLAIILFRIGQRAKEPCWAIRTNNLIRDFSSRLGKLMIQYEGAVVKDLSISRVVFWNKGRETINGVDIAAADPLRIVPLDDRRLLEVQLLRSNNEPSRLSFTASPDGRSCVLDFDYLDKGQGGVFQVVHTGTSSKDLSIVGSVKGAVRIERRTIFRGLLSFEPIRSKVSSPVRRLVEFFLLLIFTGWWAAMLANDLKRGNWIASASSLVILLFGIALIRYALLSTTVPGGLDVFDEGMLG